MRTPRRVPRHPARALREDFLDAEERLNQVSGLAYSLRVDSRFLGNRHYAEMADSAIMEIASVSRELANIRRNIWANFRLVLELEEEERIAALPNWGNTREEREDLKLASEELPKLPE
jgi:hypothetical protein